MTPAEEVEKALAVADRYRDGNCSGSMASIVIIAAAYRETVEKYEEHKAKWEEGLHAAWERADLAEKQLSSIASLAHDFDEMGMIAQKRAERSEKERDLLTKRLEDSLLKSAALAERLEEAVRKVDYLEGRLIHNSESTVWNEWQQLLQVNMKLVDERDSLAERLGRAEEMGTAAGDFIGFMMTKGSPMDEQYYALRDAWKLALDEYRRAAP